MEDAHGGSQPKPGRKKPVRILPELALQEFTTFRASALLQPGAEDPAQADPSPAPMAADNEGGGQTVAPPKERTSRTRQTPPYYGHCCAT